MNPSDQALVQKCLSATLAKVANIKKNLIAAKTSLRQQEQALYAATEQAATAKKADINLPKSPSILDGEVDMSQLNGAIKKLISGCECPNVQNPKLP